MTELERLEECADDLKLVTVSLEVLEELGLSIGALTADKSWVVISEKDLTSKLYKHFGIDEAKLNEEREALSKVRKSKLNDQKSI